MSQPIEYRARQSLGTSADAIYQAVSNVVAATSTGGGTIVDVGCGQGKLWPFVRERFDRYIGADVIRYDEFPSAGEFVRVDLDTGRVNLPAGIANVVTAVETIEHLENPRAFARELTRLAKPGGQIIVTTPNQLSLLSKLGLLVRNEFPAFRGSNYPAHLTALLETDLRRIATECRWTAVGVTYSNSGRLPGVSWHWPTSFSRLFSRQLSDNIVVFGVAPNRPEVDPQ